MALPRDLLVHISELSDDTQVQSSLRATSMDLRELIREPTYEEKLDSLTDIIQKKLEDCVKDYEAWMANYRLLDDAAEAEFLQLHDDGNLTMEKMREILDKNDIENKLSKIYKRMNRVPEGIAFKLALKSLNDTKKQIPIYRLRVQMKPYTDNGMAVFDDIGQLKVAFIVGIVHYVIRYM